ncbi:MAG: hypothetical protein J6C93_00545 [Clostridia bacterium]|nr:hypothetical protein [Clostridia bacterium]
MARVVLGAGKLFYGARCVWRGETVLRRVLCLARGNCFYGVCCAWRRKTVLRRVLCLLCPFSVEQPFFVARGKYFRFPIAVCTRSNAIKGLKTSNAVNAARPQHDLALIKTTPPAHLWVRGRFSV